MVKQPPIWMKWISGAFVVVALVVLMRISPKATLDTITTCVTVLTFIAIAWQSNETRKQAVIANKALIAQFRPRVIVRDVRLLHEDADWKISICFENLGATNATVPHAKFEIRWKTSRDRYALLHEESMDQFPLDAGGELKSVTTITDSIGFGVRFRSFQLGLANGSHGNFTMQAIGTIRYKDDSGVYNKTGFCRNLDIKTQRFLPVPNSEDEYQD